LRPDAPHREAPAPAPGGAWRHGAGGVPGDGPPSPAAQRDVRAWFDERVRPLLAEDAQAASGQAWLPATFVPGEDELEALERQLARADGAPPRTAMTLVVGWWPGHLAAVVALGAVRDGVLVRAARTGVLEVLRHPDGWLADTRLAEVAVAVCAGHPWAGRPGVEVLADRSALLAEAVAEIERAGAPVLEAVAARSRRGRAGLWAQVADGAGWTARYLQDASPTVDPQAAIAATRELLDTAGAPWRQTPVHWIAEMAGRPEVVTHRGSCCLFYQCDHGAAEERHDPDPEVVARFGGDGPRYCVTCLHRDPADVEARMRFHREREQPAHPDRSTEETT
jgi:hypothetical protein